LRRIWSRTKAIWYGAAIVLLILSIAVGSSVRLERSKQLLINSRVLTSIEPDSTVTLLSEDTALILKETQRPNTGDPRGVDQVDIYLRHLTDQKETIHPELTRFYNSLDRPYNFALVPSFDGKTVLFGQDTARATGAAVASVDSSQQYIRMIGFLQFYDVCWIGNSTQWVEYIWSDESITSMKAVVHNLDGSIAYRRFMHLKLPNAFTASFGQIVVFTPEHFMMTNWNSVTDRWPYPTEDRPASESDRATKTVLTVADIDGTASPAQVKLTEIPLEPQRKLIAAIVSPDGKSIAWLYAYDDKSQNNWYADLVSRFSRSARAGTVHRLGIWISKSDGSDLHEVGHISKNDDEDILTNVCWLSDRRSVSFVCRAKLYIRNVER